MMCFILNTTVPFWFADSSAVCARVCEWCLHSVHFVQQQFLFVWSVCWKLRSEYQCQISSVATKCRNIDVSECVSRVNDKRVICICSQHVCEHELTSVWGYYCLSRFLSVCSSTLKIGWHLIHIKSWCINVCVVSNHCTYIL